MLTSLAEAVRTRQVSAVELVHESIRRIESLNADLNAVILTDFDRALIAAQRIDDMVGAAAPLGPLCGLPLLVKDVEDVAGLRTTRGSLLLADAAPATRTGVVPRRLQRAGAVVIGKTNTPEHSFEVFTSNRLFGSTVNPWAPGYSPGGSSGGSAAALAAGLAPLATATDGGGSIRIPGAMCGLVGLKPTVGLVPRQPIPDWIDLSTDGPLASSVDDLELLLSLITGPSSGDPNAVPTPLAPMPDWQPTVLAAARTYDWGPLPAAVQTAFDTALQRLEQDLRLNIELLDPALLFGPGNPDLDWFVLCCTEQAQHIGHDYIQAHESQWDQTFLSHMRFGMAVTLDQYLTARRARFDYTRQLDELLGATKLLATPTMAVEGFTPDGRTHRSAEPGIGPEAVNTVVQNITGHPAITMPAGVLPNGVPFGLQLTGPRFTDLGLLQIARRWEQAHPWPRTAPSYTPFDQLG